MTKIGFSHSRLRVGITMGDPSGIGPLIIASAIPRLSRLADFTVIGDERVFRKNLKSRIRNHNLIFHDLDNVNHNNFESGKVKAEYGKASLQYLERALGLIRKREIDCLVTCPISKEAVAKSGCKDFTGHTEYLAQRTRSQAVAMMLLNSRIRFSLVTRHIPLAGVSRCICERSLTETILLTHRALKTLFNLEKPHMVVCALNPHASDNGLLGSEEARIISPTIKKLSKKIISISGPLAADTAIAQAAQGLYDCVIALYHDQALIPLKLLGNDTGVNLTIGLPFVRTSPLHGTAFDQARKGLGNPSSLIASIKLAVKCTLRQRNA